MEAKKHNMENNVRFVAHISVGSARNNFQRYYENDDDSISQYAW